MRSSAPRDLFLDVPQSYGRRTSNAAKPEGKPSAPASSSVKSPEYQVTTKDLIEASNKAATEKACQLLRDPTSLDNIAQLKDSIQKQLLLVQNQLQNLSSQQVEESRKAMELLFLSDKYITEMQTYFTNISATGKQNLDIIENYAIIRETLVTLQNIKKAKTGLEKLLELSNEIEQIDYLITGSFDYLLEAHEQIIQLEDIRDSALQDIASGNYDVDIHIFTDYFKKIDAISEKFENIIMKVIEEAEEKSEKAPAVVVRVLMIIEKEEDRDREKERQLEEREEMMAQQQETTTKSAKKKQKEYVREIKLKNYKEKAKAIIKNAIEERFALELAEHPTIDKKLETLTDLMEYYLADAVKYAPACFPEDWKIKETLIHEYETNLENFVHDIIGGKGQANHDARLKLLGWLENYPSLVDSFIPNPKEFSKEKQDIIGDYIAGRSEFIIECCTNAISQDLTAGAQIMYNAKKYPYTPSSVELFTLLNTQLDNTYKYNMQNVLMMIVDAARATLKLYQNQMALSAEGFLQGLKLEDEEPFRVLCALCNNATQCTEYLNQFEERLLGMVSYGEEDDTKQMDFSQIREGFDEMGQHMVSLLATQLMKIVEKAFKDLFQASWYPTSKAGAKQEKNVASTQIKNIMTTFEDYFVNDFEDNLLMPEWVDLTAELLVVRVVKRYLDGLFIVAHPTFKLETPDIIDADVKRMKLFFKKRISQDLFAFVFKPIECISEILRLREVDDIIYVFGDILENFYDLPYEVVEQLTQARTDLDKKIKNELLEGIKKTFIEHQEHQKSKVQQPTIFAHYRDLKTKAKTPSVTVSGLERQASFAILKNMTAIGKKKRKKSGEYDDDDDEEDGERDEEDDKRSDKEHNSDEEEEEKEDKSDKEESDDDDYRGPPAKQEQPKKPAGRLAEITEMADDDLEFDDETEKKGKSDDEKSDKDEEEDDDDDEDFRMKLAKTSAKPAKNQQSNQKKKKK